MIIKLTNKKQNGHSETGVFSMKKKKTASAAFFGVGSKCINGFLQKLGTA